MWGISCWWTVQYVSIRPCSYGFLETHSVTRNNDFGSRLQAQDLDRFRAACSDTTPSLTSKHSTPPLCAASSASCFPPPRAGGAGVRLNRPSEDSVTRKRLSFTYHPSPYPTDLIKWLFVEPELSLLSGSWVYPQRGRNTNTHLYRRVHIQYTCTHTYSRGRYTNQPLTLYQSWTHIHRLS